MRQSEQDKGIIPDSRAGRRFRGGHILPPKPIIIVNNAVRAFEETRKYYNSTIRETRNFAEEIYRGEPNLHTLADRMRSLFVAAREYRNRDPRIASLLEGAIYNRKVRGTSLADIEALPLPLSMDDIRRINGFARYNCFSRFTIKGDDKVVQYIAVNLPTLDLARPQEIKIPLQLRPLREQMKAYLDFYVNFIRNPFIGAEQEIGFLMTVAFTGSVLQQGLGCYIPACLGITPASALKLFDEKVSLQFMPSAWKTLKRRVEPEITNAYRTDALPEALRSYQHYDPKIDLKASSYLLQHYQNVHNELEQTSGSLEPQGIFSKFRQYQQSLRADILSSRNKFLELPARHPLISKILVATQYKQTMMFVLLLSDNQTHLTIEVNGDNRIYGIPGSLYRENPHIGVLLIKEVLDPVLDYAREQHPEINPVQITIVRSAVSEKITPTISLPTDKTEQYENPPKPPKRKNLPRLFAEPALPEPAKTGEPKNSVEYSRSQIVEFFKARMPDSTIEQIMQVIRRFELGEKQVEELKDVPGHFRLVSGNYRIIFEHKGSSKYILRDVGNRSIIYKGLRKLK